MHVVSALVFLLFPSFSGGEDVQLRILSPLSGSTLYVYALTLEAGWVAHKHKQIDIDREISASSSLIDTVCWILEAVDMPTSTETIRTSRCWHSNHVDEFGWGRVTVDLQVRGRYNVTLRGQSGGGYGRVISENYAQFTYDIDPRCSEILHITQGIMEDTGMILKKQPGLERYYSNWKTYYTHYTYYDFHPLCYHLWADEHYQRKIDYPFVYNMLNVNSASRGTFGVSHELQEFGQGDQLYLDFLLSRFRGSIQNISEFGTLRGVTSLYLGMAARLRRGKLDTFDLKDWRSEEVKEAWLPNMHFHTRDLSGAWWNRSPDNATNPFSIGGTPGAKLVALAVHEANLIFVDHVERLEFCENIARNGWLRPGTIIAVHDYPYIYSDGAFTARMLAVGCTKLMEDVSLLIFRSRIMAFQCGALES